MFQVLKVPEARVSAPLTYTGSHLHTGSSISYYFTGKNNMLTFTLFPLQSEAGNIQNISRASTFAATLCNFHTAFLAEGFTWLRKFSFHSRKMLSWAGLEHGPDKQDVVRLFFLQNRPGKSEMKQVPRRQEGLVLENDNTCSIQKQVTQEEWKLSEEDVKINNWNNF